MLLLIGIGISVQPIYAQKIILSGKILCSDGLSAHGVNITLVDDRGDIHFISNSEIGEKAGKAVRRQYQLFLTTGFAGYR